VGVTGHVTNVDPRLVEIDRLVNSHTLHGSESLCKLLRYLADHAIRKPGIALKEYQIATEVFGRPTEFDPQLDSLVRVQAGRLRSKIAEYYASEGAEDPILVELPKGTYSLTFHPATPSSKNLVRVMHEPEREKGGAHPKRSPGAVIILSSLLVISLVIIAGLLTGKITPSRSSNVDETAPPAFRVFWHAFAAGPDAPWVIFSNGAFTGRPETGLRYFDPKRE
jgi:hypothetical protein